jgi:predicted transposase/invertase (TIGR01784 family)
MNDKMGILDIKAKINGEIPTDVEMQIVNQGNIEKRMLYYWSLMYSKEIKKGEDYDKLKRTIVILFTNFDLEKLKEIPEFHTEWSLREKKHAEIVLTNVLELHIISLKKALEISGKEDEDKENQKLKLWAEFLTNPKNVEDVDMEENEAIKQAKEELEKLKQDEAEQERAYLRQKYILEMNSAKSYGYRQGVENGIEQGIEQGSKQKQIEIAKKMLDKNRPIDEIIEFTGLSKEEIEKL